MKSPIPEFGVARPGCTYELRLGAYAVFRNDAGRVAVVLTPTGCFLPGGGQESGESPEQAAKREALEECGLEIQVGRRIGMADQLISPRKEASCLRKRGVFFEAQRLNDKSITPVEPDHRFVWLPVAEAISRLSHENHRWAVRTLIGAPTPGTPARSAQVAEDILEPERRIIDPHHHLWFGKRYPDYLLDDLWRDTESGSVESVTQAVAACHHEAGGRCIIGAGCEIPRLTPPENVRALAEYARAHQNGPTSTND
jgi:8-oxo-dGTP pyrophosphatase MutT (NUDIX family)